MKRLHEVILSDVVSARGEMGCVRGEERLADLVASLIPRLFDELCEESTKLAGVLGEVGKREEPGRKRIQYG